MPSRHQHVRLTQRDLELFAYIGVAGLASQAQLHRAFWRHAQRQTAADRLLLLLQADYLGVLATAARGAHEVCYYLTRKTAQTLGERRAATLSVGAPTAAEVAHLLRTRAVLDVFERTHRLVSFTSERALKREAAQTMAQTTGLIGQQQVHPVADGRLVLRNDAHGAHEAGITTSARTTSNTSNTTMLLEIDGLYFGAHLHAKIASLAQEPLPVLWVTKREERATMLRELCAAHTHLHPIAFADLERYLDGVDGVDGTEGCPVESAEGETAGSQDDQNLHPSSDKPLQEFLKARGDEARGDEARGDDDRSEEGSDTPHATPRRTAHQRKRHDAPR